jgi:LacI family transcriptional regulator
MRSKKSEVLGDERAGGAKRSVSMTDIARRLNVSQATVSYVLNGREGNLVGQATRARVLEAAQEMGYRPNRAAQMLAGGSSHVIEVCINGFHPAFYSQVLDAYDRELRPTPYELHIVNPARSGDLWGAGEGVWPADGIIYDSRVSDSPLAALARRGVPTVSVGVDAYAEVDHVKVDIDVAYRQAVRHLASRGGRVAHLAPWPLEMGLVSPDPRYRAYRDAIREAGLGEEIILVPEVGRDAMRQATHDYIVRHGCPDAILCFNDERAIAALRALRELGLRVPDDVRLIGCDGIEETAYHSPPLSTIQYPFVEVARLAWQFLQRRIAEPKIPIQSATLKAELLLRESSAY